MLDIFSNMGPSTDQPDVGNVLSDDTVGGSAGTFENVSTSDVRDGTFWGEGGTESEGSLTVTGEVGIFFLRRR